MCRDHLFSGPKESLDYLIRSQFRWQARTGLLGPAHCRRSRLPAQPLQPATSQPATGAAQSTDPAPPAAIDLVVPTPTSRTDLPHPTAFRPAAPPPGSPFTRSAERPAGSERGREPRRPHRALRETCAEMATHCPLCSQLPAAASRTLAGKAAGALSLPYLPLVAREVATEFV